MNGCFGLRSISVLRGTVLVSIGDQRANALVREDL